MLDKLPCELVQAIVEQAAPTVANDRQCLYLNRRRFFLRLAMLSRSMQLALRPLVWQQVWVFPRTVNSFIRAAWFNEVCAAFIQELTCTGIDACAFGHLASMSAKLRNVHSLRLLGPVVGNGEFGTFRLDALEQLPLLRHVDLDVRFAESDLPNLPRLETFALQQDLLLLGMTTPPTLATSQAIFKSGATAIRRILQLKGLTFAMPGPTGRPTYQSPLAAFHSATQVELDGTAFFHAMSAIDPNALQALDVPVTLKCRLEGVRLAIDPTRLPPKLLVWVESDFRSPRDNPKHPDLYAKPYVWYDQVKEICTILCRIASCLQSLTLPLNLGIYLDENELALCRKLFHLVLRHYKRRDVAVRFHNEPPECRDSFDTAFQTLGDFGSEGVFSALLEGRAEEPELQDFEMVVV